MNSTTLREQLIELKTQKKQLEGSGRHLIVNDSTIEALGLIQATNPSGVIMYNDELTSIINKLEKPDNIDRPQYLEMFDGGKPASVARIKRGEFNVLSRTLSIIGGIQPSVLANTIHDATDPTSGKADGFIQRFQMLIAPNPIENFKPHDVNTEPPAELHELFNYLEDELPKDIIDDTWNPLIFNGNQEAYNFWLEWVEKHGKKCSAIKEEYLQAHLIKQKALLTGLALTFALIRKCDCVEVQDIKRAAGWCEYLELHARKIYAGTSSANDIFDKIMAKIKSGDIKDGDTITSIKRRKLGTGSETENALKELCDSNWIRIDKGEKKSQIVYISPHIKLDGE